MYDAWQDSCYIAQLKVISQHFPVKTEGIYLIKQQLEHCLSQNFQIICSGRNCKHWKRWLISSFLIN